MSERDGYEPGGRCRVCAVEPDPGGAASFYGELFGWETDTFVLADAEGAAFTVSQLVASQGA